MWKCSHKTYVMAINVDFFSIKGSLEQDCVGDFEPCKYYKPME